MKKFLSLLLAVMMLLGCMSVAVADDEWKINQYTQLVSRKSAAGKIENIVVPAEVNGVAVRGVEYMAFNMYKNFKTLTIADTAVMLDRSVVRDLSKLEAIDLPENLLVIREGNFTNVPMLTSVVIPASVAVVQSSFNKCTSLKSITFEGACPVFVTAGTYGMFTELPADCVIYVPDNQVDAYKAAFADREDVVARIQPSGQYASAIDWTAPEGDFVFDAATGTITGYTGAANYLKIPAAIGGVQVKHIAADAFVKCHSVCCVVIPEGVETVGDWAFAGISLLSYVSLPSTLVTMGSSAFSSAYMSAITFGGEAVPTFDASAFGGFKGDWQLILPYGSSQEYVDAFAAYLAPAAAAGVVQASLTEPYKFPALDAEAGAPFIGYWFSVAGKDVMGDFIEYYPATTAILNSDGTGMINMDGDEMAIAWFVDSGYAIIAPRAQDGSAYEDQAFAYANIDENGRLYVDFGYIGVICEQEGATYAAPARPEEPWPDFDLSNATYFIGTWEAIEYNVEGESYPVELIGPMAVTLNDDGSALLVEGEEEAYELRWYAEYAVAYMGENMSDRVEITFDGNGNIKLDMIDVVVILAPKAAVKVITGADELLGDWYDDLGNKLTLTNDGTMIYTYASDGWTYEDSWDVVDGSAVVTAGRWEGAAIYTRDGLVFVDNDEGIFQIFSVDGDLSAYYGDDDELPEAQPIGAEGEPYFGAWKGDMFGMEVILTLNQDGTCTMDMMGDTEPGVWSIVDGKASVMGDEIYIDGDGKLVYEAQGMIFTKVEEEESDDEMSEEELLALLALLAQMAGQEEGSTDNTNTGFSYVDTDFVLTKAATVFNGQSFPVDAAAFGEYTVRFNSNGSAKLVQSGLELPSEYLTWSNNAAGEYVIEYSVNGVHIMEYVFVPADGAMTFDYFGTLMTFTPAE